MAIRVRVGILLCAAALLVGGCSDEDEGYPEEIRDNFVTACTGNGGEESACECVFREIEKRIPLDEFIEMDQEGAEAALDDPRVVEAGEVCRGEQ